MIDKVKWGVLGTGNIARIFAMALLKSSSSMLYAVGSRNELTAETFASDYGATKYYPNYESLLADPEVSAVYIALPHSMHAEWAIKAAKAKKHILCEKPLTMNYQEALKVVEAAKQNCVLLMEAFLFRFHPQTHELKKLLKSKIIGDVHLINATFSFQSEGNRTESHEVKALGGGAILDVGCYPISMAMLIMGEIYSEPILEPDHILGVSSFSSVGIDECSICSMKFPGGVLAQVSSGISLIQENGVKIFGTKGRLNISSPWIPGGRNPGITKIDVYSNENPIAKAIYIETEVSPTIFLVNHFVECMTNKKSWIQYSNESLVNMKILDEWRNCAGVIY